MLASSTNSWPRSAAQTCRGLVDDGGEGVGGRGGDVLRACGGVGVELRLCLVECRFGLSDLGLGEVDCRAGCLSLVAIAVAAREGSASDEGSGGQKSSECVLEEHVGWCCLT